LFLAEESRLSPLLNPPAIQGANIPSGTPIASKAQIDKFPLNSLHFRVDLIIGMKNKNTNLDSHNKRNSLGMTKQVYKQLLKKLDDPNTQRPTQPIKRAFTRLEYLEPYFELILEKTDHAHRRKITVASRNISRGGMSILHSNFIYPGTSISANLRKTDGETAKITGKVCRCNHRGGVVHEIGIQFDHEIIVQEFICPDINDAVKSFETIDPTTLTGKILFVGADASITPFIREYLLSTSLDFGFEDHAEDALHKELDDYQLLFVSLDAGTMSGPEYIRCIRDAGYNKPIILSGRAKDDQIKQQIRLSAADMFLPVPLTENSLLCALGEFLVTQWSEHTLESVRKGSSQESVEELHQELSDLAKVLDAQLQVEDSVEVYITCTKIRNISSLLGMKSLHSLTFTVCEEIADTGNLEKFAEELASINLICKSANKAA